MASKQRTVTQGSDNVFADIGLDHPEERLAKARIASAIIDLIEELGLTQAAAAKQMGLDQPKVSRIKRGRLDEFSVDRLLTCVALLGVDVNIVLTKQKTNVVREGTVRVIYDSDQN